ncbi:MAG: hypothetical protein GWN44_03905, partial [Calditrichae bacterium]|nr:hypothetical protein [Calditrichia bacterium]
MKPYNVYQRILNEIELLDFAVTDHPLTLFESNMNKTEIVPSYQLQAHKGDTIKFVG